MIDRVACFKSRNAKKACESINAKSWFEYVSSLCRSHSFLSRTMLIIKNMSLSEKSSRLPLWSCRVVYKREKTRMKAKRRLCDDEDIWLCWISRYQQIRNQHRVQIVLLLINKNRLNQRTAQYYFKPKLKSMNINSKRW